MTPPRTPFSTPLSGSAREARLRLRSILQGPKKGPPAPLAALLLAAALLCVGLVSCQTEEAPAPDTEPDRDPQEAAEGVAQRFPADPDSDGGQFQAVRENLAPYSGPAEAAQTFSEVLLNGAPFTLVGDQLTSYGLSELNMMFWGDPEVNAYAEQFTVADLDADGTPEVVLLTNQHIHSDPILILRWQDGQIYGYNEVGRGMQSLKEDGTSHWSNSAFHNGTHRDQYIADGDGPDRREKLRLSEFVADAGGTAEYYLSGQEVTRAEYEAAEAAQEAKPDVRWYRFQADQISAVFPTQTGGTP